MHWICLADLTSHDLPRGKSWLCLAMADCTRTRRVVQNMRARPVGQSQKPNLRGLTRTSVHQALQGCPHGNGEVSPKLTNNHRHTTLTQAGNP